MTNGNVMKKAPGVRWVVILGVAGFAAGFIGPMFFVPDANQGPMVGIFISGPAGVALGSILYGLCSLFKVAASTQWRLLYFSAAVGVLVTLIFVQPAPALEGTLLKAEVTKCSPPIDVESDTIKYWEQRIANVTWATPREGWQQDMHQALQDASGIMLQLTITHKNQIYKNRKPWNRGELFASGWKETYEKKLFYRPDGSCQHYAPGNKIKAFQHYDFSGRIEAPTAWPPLEMKDFIDASILSDVPETMQQFQ